MGKWHFLVIHASALILSGCVMDDLLTRKPSKDTSTKSFDAEVSSRRDLEDENIRLKTQNGRLESEVERLRTQLSETERRAAIAETKLQYQSPNAQTRTLQPENSPQLNTAITPVPMPSVTKSLSTTSSRSNTEITGTNSPRAYSTPSPVRYSGGHYIRGPRGGCYTYSGSGRKRYVDRSLCN